MLYKKISGFNPTKDLTADSTTTFMKTENMWFSRNHGARQIHAFKGGPVKGGEYNYSKCDLTCFVDIEICLVIEKNTHSHVSKNFFLKI